MKSKSRFVYSHAALLLMCTQHTGVGMPCMKLPCLVFLNAFASNGEYHHQRQRFTVHLCLSHTHPRTPLAHTLSI